MRLTASRQPYNISRPKNSRHPKTILGHQNDSFTPPLYNCKPTIANTKQGENTGPYSAPYGETTQAPNKSARQSLLLELPTIDSGPAFVACPLTQQLKSFPPKSHCPQQPTARHQSLTQEDKWAGCAIGTGGRILRHPHIP
jgi:hypothetical protein